MEAIVITEKGQGPALNRAVINMVYEINKHEEATLAANSNHEKIQRIKARLHFLDEVEEAIQVKIIRLQEEYKTIVAMLDKELEGLYSHAKKFKKDPAAISQVKPLIDAKEAEKKAIDKEVDEMRKHITTAAKKSIKMNDMIRRYA